MLSEVNVSDLVVVDVVFVFGALKSSPEVHTIKLLGASQGLLDLPVRRQVFVFERLLAVEVP